MKRRRLNDNTSYLSKPFKSPVIRKKQDPQQSPVPVTTTDEQNNEKDVVGDGMIEDSSSRPKQTPTRTRTRTPTVPPDPPARPPPPSALPTSPPRHHDSNPHLSSHYTRLLTTLSSLNAQLTTVQSALDILRAQAQKSPLAPTKSPTPSSLETSIEQYRYVSQSAAEELYATALDKVKGMEGGVRGYNREITRQRNQPSFWDNPPPPPRKGNIDEDGDSEDGGGGLDNYEAKEEAHDRDAEVEREREEEEEEEFTMSKFLRQMGIDPKLLGWDEKEERWT